MSYFDVTDAERSVEKLSSAAFPVEVQFCVNVVPPLNMNPAAVCSGSSEIEDVMKQGDVYFDEHKLLIINARSANEVVQFCARYGKITRFDKTEGIVLLVKGFIFNIFLDGIIAEFTNIRSCAACFEGMSNLSPTETIRALPIPLNKT